MYHFIKWISFSSYEHTIQKQKYQITVLTLSLTLLVKEEKEEWQKGERKATRAVNLCKIIFIYFSLFVCLFFFVLFLPHLKGDGL
jgi:hypothetical protein